MNTRPDWRKAANRLKRALTWARVREMACDYRVQHYSELLHQHAKTQAALQAINTMAACRIGLYGPTGASNDDGWRRVYDLSLEGSRDEKRSS